MKPKITLPVWASRHYDPPPVKNTLRIWLREGRIVPAPVKLGARITWIPTRDMLLKFPQRLV
ncbi:excisionase [Variovorax sp. J22G73]|uniref:excisionase n=1 Tax=unclassified Variovorax TaxID=663243 RepID=UPI002575147C|nr:excisionase [Variovorax sp. J22G73]MDM0103015.1 excisionase [Variovorax sp. J22G73]